MAKKKAKRSKSSCGCPSGMKKATFKVARCRTKKGRFSSARACAKK